MFLLVPGERMGTTPRSNVQSMPTVLSSGVGSDRTRPNRLDLWNLNGSDPIGSDRSFGFRCRTAAGEQLNYLLNRLNPGKLRVQVPYRGRTGKEGDSEPPAKRPR